MTTFAPISFEPKTDNEQRIQASLNMLPLVLEDLREEIEVMISALPAAGGAAALDPAVILAPDSATRNRVQPTGAYPGLILRAPASGTPNLLELETAAGVSLAYVSNGGNLTLSRSASGSNVELVIENTNSAADSNSMLRLRANGSATAGDNIILFQTATGGRIIATDASDNEKHKFIGAAVMSGVALMTLDYAQNRVGIGPSNTSPSHPFDFAYSGSGIITAAIRNTGTGVNTTAGANLLVEDNHGGGDARITLSALNGSSVQVNWTVGNDGNDSGSLVVSESSTLGTNNRFRIASGGAITLYSDIVLPTVTGTKIGTSTSQLLGFWNASPVAQYNTTGTVTGFTAGAGTAVLDDSTFTGNTGSTAYTMGDVVRALKLSGIMAT